MMGAMMIRHASPLVTSPFALAAAVSLALVACGDSDPSEGVKVEVAKSSLTRERNPAADDAALTSAVISDEAFAADLHKQLVLKDASKNLFFSPHSVSSAFAMLYGGAATQSQIDIAKTFHFADNNAAFHAARNKLALALESRANAAGKGTDGKGFRLALNNSFWGEKTFTWGAGYLDVLGKNYGAGIYLNDFVADFEKGRHLINSWTETNTEGRIKELLPEGSLDSSTRFVLVNTVYFNAAWVEQFIPTNMDFTNAGLTSNVPAITNTGSFRYSKNANGDEVVAVPYEGSQVEFVALLPKDIAAYEGALDGTTLHSLFASLTPGAVSLTMPKLKIEGATISLKEQLSALGLASIFGAEADFSPITASAKLQIDDVYHQAFVKLNEKGTEAAAATAITARETSAILDPVVVNLNRPYLFFIRDVPTGEILFQGRIVSPSYSE